MTSDQQCSPVVRYWRKCFRRTEMEMISEDVTRSARFRGSNGEKEMWRHFLESGVQMKIRVEDYIQDEVLRIILCSCVTLDFGEANISHYGCLLENGVHNDDRELSSGEWGSNGERGSLFGSKSDMKLSGFKCGDQGSFARKKNICVGVQQKKIKEVFGVQEKVK